MSTFSENLQRAKQGDVDALYRIFRAQTNRLDRILRSCLRGPLRRRYDTIDLRQSVILEVLEELERFEDRGEQAFRNWLAIKARNKVRTKFRRILLNGGRLREIPMADDRPEPQSRIPSPLESASRDEDHRELRAALEELPPEYREVLHLRDREAMSYREVAGWMGLPSADAARKMHARALVKLRSRMRSA